MGNRFRHDSPESSDGEGDDSDYYDFSDNYPSNDRVRTQGRHPQKPEPVREANSIPNVRQNFDRGDAGDGVDKHVQNSRANTDQGYQYCPSDDENFDNEHEFGPDVRPRQRPVVHNDRHNDGKVSENNVWNVVERSRPRVRTETDRHISQPLPNRQIARDVDMVRGREIDPMPYQSRESKYLNRRPENERYVNLPPQSDQFLEPRNDLGYRGTRTAEDDVGARSRHDRYGPRDRYRHDNDNARNYGTGRRSYRKERNPEKFDGEKAEWPDYHKHFETVANWNGWGEQEKAMQLVMSLQGEALRVLGDLSDETQNDYEALVDELTRRFNPAEREAAWRLEFRNRMRTTSETAMQYGYALKRLATKAFPSLTLSAQEQWVMDQFVTGLGNFELRKHVQFGHPNTLNAAISLAVEYEAFDSNAKPKKPVVKPGEISRLDNGQNAQGSDKPRWYSDKSKVRCYNCQEMGHMSRECPKSNRGNSRGYQGERANNHGNNGSHYQQNQGSRGNNGSNYQTNQNNGGNRGSNYQNRQGNSGSETTNYPSIQGNQGGNSSEPSSNQGDKASSGSNTQNQGTRMC
jgi:hypothetical protein